MRHHDDVPHAGDDAERDLTQEFWGGASGWDDRKMSRSARSVTRAAQPADDTTGAMRAIRDGLVAFRPRTTSHATGEIRRVRHHGAVTGEHPAFASEVEPSPRATDGWQVNETDHAVWNEGPVRVAGEWEWADEDSDDDLVPLGPPTIAERYGLGAVDPLLVRMGLLVMAAVLLVPLALALRSDDADTVTTGSGEPSPSAAVTTVAPAPSSSTTLASVDPIQPAVQEATPPDAQSDPPADAPDSTTQPPAAEAESTDSEPVVVEQADKTETAVQSSESRTSGLNDEPAIVAALADRIEPNCSLSYVARQGDSWYSVAGAADVTPTELISENRASLETIIVPGDEICLPDGASVPSTAPPTTDADETEAPSTTAAPNTTVPPSTAPSPTVPPPSVEPATTDEVQQIIRDVWPDDLEDKALDIAFRESRYNARAYNGWCCYGVFQLYWSVHRSWLDDHGISSIEDLYDARKNTEAAYALYRASGGWGPWGG